MFSPSKITGNTLKKLFFATIFLMIVIIIWECRISRIALKENQKQNRTKIFFLETSGHGGISLRFLTGVESAALRNPDKDVVVYLFPDATGSSRRELTSPMVGLGKKYPNVEYVATTIEEFVRNSPLEKWYREGNLKRSSFQEANASDGMRLLELLRSGGIYLDFDILTIERLDLPKNAVFQEADHEQLSNAVLVFQRPGHPLMFMAVNQFVNNYNPNGYGLNGPPVIDKNYYKYVEYKKVLGEDPDVELFPARTFFPYKNWDWKNYFETDKKEEVFKTINGSVAIHWWNFLSKVQKVEADLDCAFMDLVKVNSPFVYSEIQKQGWV